MKLPAGFRMIGNIKRQETSRKKLMLFPVPAVCCGISVAVVTQYRTAKCCHLCADLVRPAGVQCH